MSNLNKLAWEEVDNLTGWLVQLRWKSYNTQQESPSYMVVCFHKNECVWGSRNKTEEGAIESFNTCDNNGNSLHGLLSRHYEINPIRKIF